MSGLVPNFLPHNKAEVRLASNIAFAQYMFHYSIFYLASILLLAAFARRHPTAPLPDLVLIVIGT
jgi:hypothetical protein